jgi:hypothetical protein
MPDVVRRLKLFLALPVLLTLAGFPLQVFAQVTFDQPPYDPLFYGRQGAEGALAVGGAAPLQQVEVLDLLCCVRS